jgi:hypothetical protein
MPQQQDATWPELPYEAWRDTAATLHLWLQIVGKIALVQRPWVNHSWHVALRIAARGIGTGLIPHQAGAFQIDFDFVEHRLVLHVVDGRTVSLKLQPQTTAHFYLDVMRALTTLGVPVKIHTLPNELPDPIRFDADELHSSYDPESVNRYWRTLVQAASVFEQFRARFIGKSSPVHFFWGAFDLALTRFSGRRAPEPKSTEWWVLREAMSHEEISFGFWPGSGTVAEPAFYAYVRPEPPRLPTMSVRPGTAYYSRELADFILPYESVRSVSSPDDAVLDFYQSVYDAGADLAGWDRAALDRPPAEWP